MARNRLGSSGMIWDFQWRRDILAARLRGRSFGVLGRLSEGGRGHNILIGPHDRSYFESGSQIILEQNLASAPPNSPTDFNQFKYALGVLNPRRYQNPPNRVSRFRLLEKAKLRLALHTRVGPGFYFSIGPNCEVSVGSWTYIGSDLDAYVRVGITIGNHCMISHGVTLMDYDGHSITSNGSDTGNIDAGGGGEPVNFGGAKSILIEDHVWIGAGVTILKGVRVGKGAVIGMNSVVTKDVPSRAIVCGNPATVVKKDISWKHF